MNNWEVGECDNAILVQSVEVCHTCNKHKVVSWIGKDFPDAKEQDEIRMAELNRERKDPASYIDARPTRFGCDHYKKQFRRDYMKNCPHITNDMCSICKELDRLKKLELAAKHLRHIQKGYHKQHHSLAATQAVEIEFDLLLNPQQKELFECTISSTSEKSAS